MTKRAGSVLIGDLLVKAEFITLEQLASAMPTSQEKGVPVGRVLVGLGYLTDARLRAGLLAQSLIRDNFLQPDLAVKALKVVGNRKIHLEEALRQLGWKSEYYEFTNQLGQLLLSAGLVDEDRLEKNLEVCFTTGLPLGRILVLQDELPDWLAYAALTAQMLIRQGKVTREQAIEALKTASERRTSLEESLDFHGFLRLQPVKTIRLGELLVLSGVVSEVDLITATERSIVDEQPLGQVLVECNLITQNILDGALKLHKMISEHFLTPLQAAEGLKRVARGVPVSEAVREAHALEHKSEGKLELSEVMKLVGLLPSKDVDDAVEQGRKINAPFESILLVNGTVDQPTLAVARRCETLLNSGRLSLEQCIFAVHSWLWETSDFDEILERLGWIPSL